jgi:hypothetical protein
MSWQELDGIALRLFRLAGKVQRDVPMAWQQTPDQAGLAYLPRSGDNHGRK